jgi:hypothetical protein
MAAAFNLSSSSSPPLSCPRVSNHFKLFNDLPHVRVNYKIPSTHNNAAFSVKAKLVTGGGDLLSYPKDTNDLVVGAQVVQIKEQLNGTLTSDSEITSTSFPVDYNEFDLESPQKVLLLSLKPSKTFAAERLSRSFFVFLLVISFCYFGLVWIDLFECIY